MNKEIWQLCHLFYYLSEKKIGKNEFCGKKFIMGSGDLLIINVNVSNSQVSFDTLLDALTYADNVLLYNQKKRGITIKYVQSYYNNSVG